MVCDAFRALRLRDKVRVHTGTSTHALGAPRRTPDVVDARFCSSPRTDPEWLLVEVHLAGSNQTLCGTISCPPGTASKSSVATPSASVGPHFSSLSGT